MFLLISRDGSDNSLDNEVSPKGQPEQLSLSLKYIAERMYQLFKKVTQAFP